MWCQCLVWLFLVAFVGKKKEQTINVLLGAYKLLLALQSLCPEPSQATWLWEGKRRSCLEGMVTFLYAQLWGGGEQGLGGGVSLG